MYHLEKIANLLALVDRFDNSNTENLILEMSIEEKRKFGFNIRNIDWEDYFVNVHLPGLRKHVLKK